MSFSTDSHPVSCDVTGDGSFLEEVIMEMDLARRALVWFCMPQADREVRL